MCTQPYLSEDRSSIYTEYTLAPEEVFKANGTLIGGHQGEISIDRPGGILRLATGKVVEGGPTICYLGHLQTGRRYVVFAHRSNGEKNLQMFKGYGLQGGRVLRLDPASEKLPQELFEEFSFLDSIRRAMSESHTRPNKRIQRRPRSEFRLYP